MKKIILTVFLLAVTSLHCGYSTSSLLPSNYRIIHVEDFENQVGYTTSGTRELYFPLMEVAIRNAVVNRYQFDGNLRIGEAEQADIILKGELLSYNRSGLRYNDNDDVEEYRLHITVHLTLLDTETEEIVWEEPGFVGETTYFISGPLAISEETAVEEAIEDLARRVVERTIENW